MHWIWIAVGALVVYVVVAILVAIGRNAKSALGLTADATVHDYRSAARNASSYDEASRQREDQEKP